MSIAEPVSDIEADRLFADLATAPALILAVSGGPDSTALLVLAARWRKRLKRGPKLVAVTVDHGLRAQARLEALAVKKLAQRLGVAHRTVKWGEKKPKTGLQAKARNARYRLLAGAARAAGALHLMVAHTLDDQAETVLFRLARGSGIAGLGAMTRISPLPAFRSAPSPLVGEGRGGGSISESALQSPPSRRATRVDPGSSPGQALPHKGGGNKEKSASGEREVLLVRPFIDIPKARLVATLRARKIAFADDPSNHDPRFTRARLRPLMQELAAEGLHAERLATVARRMRRADTTIEAVVDAAAQRMARTPGGKALTIDLGLFMTLPEEVALRLLGRAIAQCGNEGPVELGKLEDLFAALASALAAGMRFRRTLAGAMVTLTPDRIAVERAPARGNRGKTARKPRRNTS